jgi:hypothetical protein
VPVRQARRVVLLSIGSLLVVAAGSPRIAPFTCTPF